MIAVRSLSSYDDTEAALERYHAVDAACFGGPPEPAAFAEKRTLIEPDRWFSAEIDGEPCGGSGSFATELTLPGGVQVPVAAVSDVGVLPTHRRRGVLTALMGHQLRDFVDRGESAAVLHASEGSIYRRFGYGPTTRWRQARIDCRRVQLRHDAPRAGGSLRVVPRAEAFDACRRVHDRARLARPGGLARSDAWWRIVLGESGLYLGGNARHLVIVHADDAGEPDGYAIYSVHEDWTRGQANHTLEVWELVGVDAAVDLELWRTLIHHDLVHTVVGPIAVDHPLWDVVVDARQVGVAWEQDLLWLRPLDVAGLLASRTYAGSGRLVIEVVDEAVPELGVGGRFELEVADGVARCEPSADAAELIVGVSDLGSVLLGGGSFRRLVRAGRLDEARGGAAAQADALFTVEPSPWCWVRF